jgi:hypothetical protein
MVRTRRWFRSLAIPGLAATIACDPGASLYSRTNDPMVVLILSRSGSLLFDVQLSAVFATTGVPTHVEFVSAESFETFRTSDNARFDWKEVVPPPPAGGGLPFRPTSGNYVLEDNSTSNGLGRADLQPGETYRLSIQHSGRTIEGTTRMPDLPQPRVVQTPEGLRVVWRKLDGVPLYLVLGATVKPAVAFNQQLTSDTVAVPILIGDLASSVRVIALDSNYARYLSDTLSTQSGVVGARGVFGSMSSMEVVVR